MGGERGWAQALLSWGWRGMVLEAEVSVCRYFVRPAVGEVIAWGEVREAGGRVRVEVGSFGRPGRQGRHASGMRRGACVRSTGRRGARPGVLARVRWMFGYRLVGVGGGRLLLGTW